MWVNSPTLDCVETITPTLAFFIEGSQASHLQEAGITPRYFGMSRKRLLPNPLAKVLKLWQKIS